MILLYLPNKSNKESYAFKYTFGVNPFLTLMFPFGLYSFSFLPILVSKDKTTKEKNA